MMTVQTGLAALIADPAPIKGRKWALLANQASVTTELEAARTALARVAGRPTLLFAPEHGLDGVAQDMESVGDEIDRLTDAPVRSLYGNDVASLAPTRDDLENLDVVVIDVPDIGARYYTFAATMDALMETCSDAAVEVLVLDRPNPIGGVAREGGLVRPGFESFVGQIPTPIRHGLTLGEIALLLHRERYPDLELTVIPCSGWKRNQLFEETGLSWVVPSPNMPTLETVLIYPGLCLVEATNLSEGRGTTRPFHLVGAPWVDAEALVDTLRKRSIPGAAFRATRFRPEFSKHAGTVCEGIEIHVIDREVLRPVALGLHLLKTLHFLHPGDFAWRSEAYEFVEDIPAIDLLTGSARARQCIEGSGEIEELLEEWRQEVRGFEAKLDGVLLYHESGGYRKKETQRRRDAETQSRTKEKITGD